MHLHGALPNSELAFQLAAVQSLSVAELANGTHSFAGHLQ